MEFDHDLIFITESWRSQERQNYLYSLGRTIPGKTVTWTKDSEHTKGEINDFYGITDDVSNRGHHGNGDYEIKLTDSSKLVEVKDLIRNFMLKN
ncbi:MAG: hypothetical protein Q8K30_04255 [Candidatus Gracilibacteria bacterium]|nr:hypothetical protein [Candidatus Gracilibacteria bacterium]